MSIQGIPACHKCLSISLWLLKLKPGTVQSLSKAIAVECRLHTYSCVAKKPLWLQKNPRNPNIRVWSTTKGANHICRQLTTSARELNIITVCITCLSICNGNGRYQLVTIPNLGLSVTHCNLKRRETAEKGVVWRRE